jgi:two-component system sensor histidine kinase DctS
MTMAVTSASGPRPWLRRRTRRVLLWAALIALLAVAQTLLVVLTLRHESSRVQDHVEDVAGAAAVELERDVSRDVQSLQALLWNDPSSTRWRQEAGDLLRERRALLRIERRDDTLSLMDAVDSPYRPPAFERIPRPEMDMEAQFACSAVRRTAAPHFSRSYFVPQGDGAGLEVIDVCLPGGGFEHTVATFSLAAMLEGAASEEQLRNHELTFVEGDGTRLARAGTRRGAGVYRAERVANLPGVALQLRVDSAERSPSLIPNVTTALVLGLSLALFGVVSLLVRDVRRRASAEIALAEALAFRKAMEDSLITGLRARDLQGRISYVNPAFCAMVGFSADELVGAATAPYWPPERVAEYEARQALRRSGGTAPTESREGHETEFMRKNGERFPVVVYEAPLVDRHGEHTGWMSAVLDMSAQRKVEELSRQQQDRLAATARLATVGEMASLLSHELNQPLAAIASYAAGSLNLMAQPGGDTEAMVRQAVGRIAEQAERAGRVIKSVHDFVRRRDQVREPVRCDDLVDAVLPLVRLQARKSGTRIDVDVHDPVPRVMADRTMVEQVLLNLTRNGIQAMESQTPLAARVLSIKVLQTHARWVAFEVSDAGPGIPPDVAQRLFTPFFTTRTEGMGLGLSLCRTVVEQHGGVLDFAGGAPHSDGTGGGTTFRFTLPAA